MRELQQPDRKLFAKRLTQVRKAKGFAQVQDACDALGLPKTTYGKYEAGYRFPKMESLIELCNFYNICPLWVMGCVDSPATFGNSPTGGVNPHTGTPKVDESLDGLKARILGDDGNIFELSLRLMQTN